MEEGRKCVLGIIAGILIARHLRAVLRKKSIHAGRVKGLGAVGFIISYTLITSAQTHCFPSRE
jgi:hypothetical protein